VELKKKKLPLPQGWQIEVEAYLQMKESVKASWFAEYLEAQADHIDALRLSRYLHGNG
jgi:hypothetical protein